MNTPSHFLSLSMINTYFLDRFKDTKHAQSLRRFAQSASLQKIDAQNYIGDCEDLGLPQVYGGQVIGQALSAAKQTVCETRFVHSFHSYFLQPGDPNQPIHYDVENIRDGKSFSTRRVRAMQAQQPIFYLTASYQVVESGLNHQSSMPQTTGPEGLASESQLFQMMAKQVPPSIQKLLGGERAIEMRPVTINNPLAPQKTEPKHAVWLRANGALPDDYRIHQYLLRLCIRLEFSPHQFKSTWFVDPHAGA